MSNGGNFVRKLLRRTRRYDDSPFTLHHLKRSLENGLFVRRCIGPRPHDTAAMATVEPEENPLAFALVKEPFDLTERHRRRRDVSFVGIVTYEVVLTAINLAMPCEIDEYRIVCRRRERNFGIARIAFVVAFDSVSTTVPGLENAPFLD